MNHTTLIRQLALAAVGCLVWCGSISRAEYTNNSEETKALVAQALKDATPEVMTKLGDIYAEGKGVEKDLSEAAIWYSFADSVGGEEAHEKLWDMEQSLRKKPIKRVNKGKPYNKEATINLCAYLQLTNTPGTNVEPAAVPKGVKLESALGGMYKAPEYDGAVVRKFIMQGADPNANIPTNDIPNCSTKGGHVEPRRVVAYNRDYKTLDMMIAYGMTVNDRNNAILDVAIAALDAEQSNPKMKPTDKSVQYGLSRGMQLGVRSDWGSTPIMGCTGPNDNAEGIEYLVGQGADVNAAVEMRYLPLCKERKKVLGARAIEMGVYNCNLRAVAAMIKAGVELNFLTGTGKTMLDAAEESTKPKNTSCKTYDAELARLMKLSDNYTATVTNVSSGKKKTKTTKVKGGGHRWHPNKGLHLGQLIRLAGGKTASELNGAAPGNDTAE